MKMNTEAFLDLFRAAILTVVLLSAFHLIDMERFTARMVFFTLAIACILLTDFYWLSYDILRPEARMPFAANEIGEWALFLLLGASLNSGKPLRLREAKWETLCAVLFSAANTALWIAWSGEWVQDILTGLAFAYFLCSLVYQIKAEEVFSPSQWRLLGLICVLLIVGQMGTFFAAEPIRKPLDLFCYAFLFLVALCLLVNTFRAIRKETAPANGVCKAFTAFAWVVITMYMSSGGFYDAAMVLSALCFPLMFLALKKEVDAV